MEPRNAHSSARCAGEGSPPFRPHTPARRRRQCRGDRADSLDLLISEGVFDHLQRDTLEEVVAAIARWLRPTGIALIRPNVFTGITGGHLIEWSRRAAPAAARASQRALGAPATALVQNQHLPERADPGPVPRTFRVHFEILE